MGEGARGRRSVGTRYLLFSGEDDRQTVTTPTQQMAARQARYRASGGLVAAGRDMYLTLHQGRKVRARANRRTRRRVDGTGQHSLSREEVADDGRDKTKQTAAIEIISCSPGCGGSRDAAKS